MRPIHRICGKHCGQLPPAAAQSAQLLASEQIAANLSREFLLPINHLHEHDRPVTRLGGLLYADRRSVEFSHRNIGALDG
jgi:hypothetical protein